MVFQPGDIIESRFGAPIVVREPLGEGGSCTVWLVEFRGEKKALKWYKKGLYTDSDSFYVNLKNNIDHGAPDRAFLWPESLTQRMEGEFGIIMPLIPEEYKPFDRFLVGREKFKTFKEIAEAAIRITCVFRNLHSIGYAFRSLHDGNLFIDPANGDVLIAGCEDVAPNGTHTGIIGKPRYMAPELVVGDGAVMPDVWSDRYSLAVILFMLLFASHPLEGKKWLTPCLTYRLFRTLYGENPVFVLDEKDVSNRPVEGIHVNLLNVWPLMPDYIKNAFRSAFSREALHHPQRRMTESDWLEVLARFRSNIAICACGNSILLKDTGDAICDECGIKFAIPHALQLPGYAIPGIPGTRVYHCQLGVCNIDSSLDPIAVVVSDEQGRTFFKNETNAVWPAVTPSGRMKRVPPGGCVPLIAGIEIQVFGRTIKINK